MPTHKVLSGPRHHQVEICYEVVTHFNQQQQEELNERRSIVLTLGGHKGVKAARNVAMILSFKLKATVVIWDRRNTHDSGVCYGNQPLVLDDVEDLKAVIEALSLAPTLLMGSSSGARVSAICALKYPSLVSGLVLAPPTGGNIARTIAEAYYEVPAQIAVSRGMKQVVIDNDNYVELCQTSKAALISDVSVEQFCRTMQLSSDWLKMHEKDTLLGIRDDELTRLAIFRPLIVHDGNIQDPFHTVQTAVGCARILQCSEIKLIPGILQQTEKSSELIALAIHQTYFLQNCKCKLSSLL